MNWLKEILGLDKQEKKLQDIEDALLNISGKILPEPFNSNFEVVDPLNNAIKLFTFNKETDVSLIKKTKIDTDTKSFIRVFAAGIPELTSNALLANSYRFVFPQGMSGEVMKIASGQGTAIMQSGKILTHGTYVLNMAVAAPLMAVTIGSMIIRQHYLAKINKNLDEINQKVSQLLEFEFIKKQSQIESIIYFLEKVHHDFTTIEHNQEYRNSILTNLVRTNSEIFELIQFYKKSLKFIENEKTHVNKLNLDYFIALHRLFYFGKLLEFKYANEYNEILISNLKTEIHELVALSNEFLNINKQDIEKQISDINPSYFDWVFRKKKKKEEKSSNLQETKSIVDQLINFQEDEVIRITSELTEFQNNITKKQDYLIENGEVYEVLGNK